MKIGPFMRLSKGVQKNMPKAWKVTKNHLAENFRNKYHWERHRRDNIDSSFNDN